MKKISLFFFIIFFVGTLLSFVALNYTNPYQLVCHLVNENIYKKDEKLTQFYSRCLSLSKRVNIWTSPDLMIASLRQQFEALGLSHLQIYNQKENNRIWKGQSEETGIQTHFIDGEMVIVHVDKDSPADIAHLEMGDIILKINGETPQQNDAEFLGGEFEVEHENQMSIVTIVPTTLQKDESLQIEHLNSRISLLKASSMRKEFFEVEELIRIAEELSNSKKIILDLRGNSGGNFVAGLRLATLFLCGEQAVGYLYKPRNEKKKVATLIDDLDDSAQIQILKKNDLVTLKTFSEYPCLSQPMVVLVDENTASTAEMVAQILKDYRGAKIVGVPTAGALLQGVWYDLPEFGPGVSISIPEALYQTQRGHIIEGHGVSKLDKIVNEKISDFRKGQDSWVLQAIEVL